MNYKKILIYLIDSIVFSIFYLGRMNFRFQSQKNVLVVRVDHIGDFLLWYSQIKKIRDLFPEKKYNITLIGNKSWIGILPSGIFNEVIAIDRKKFFIPLLYRYFILYKIFSTDYSYVINPTFSRNFNLDDSIVRFSKSKNSFGHIGDESNQERYIKRISNKWYKNLIKIDANKLNEFEINSDFTKKLGIDSDPELANLPPIQLSSNANIQGEYFVVAPGGSWLGKCWSPENFAKIAIEITKGFGLRGVICGSINEKEIANKVNEMSNSRLIDLSGETTLEEVISILRNAKIIISNDNGIAHIAAALTKPMVCILGGGHYGRFFPYPNKLNSKKMEIAYHPMECFGCNWNCVYKTKKNEELPCIKAIEYESVLSKVTTLLKNCKNG
jgi:ADP-heptose:LPS heptosyltransferase